MRFVFLCLVSLCFALPVFAADSRGSAAMIEKEFRSSPRTMGAWRNSMAEFTERYDTFVADIYRNPEHLESQIGILRSYYARTEQYTPFSKSVLDEMTRYATVVMDEEGDGDREEINEALIAYKKLLDKHLTNFDVLSFALTMARVDVRFGDEIFYKRVMGTLIKNFARKNMGSKPDRAYHIVSFGEEQYLLERYGGKIVKSEIYEVNGKYYNVHDLNTPDGAYVQIYMDITQPIKNVVYNRVVKDTGLERAILPR